MSLRTWNLPHPYIICNLRSPLRGVKIARLSGRSVLCREEGQDGEGWSWGEPEDWATEPSRATQEIQPMRWLRGSPGKRGPAALWASFLLFVFVVGTTEVLNSPNRTWQNLREAKADTGTEQMAVLFKTCSWHLSLWKKWSAKRLPPSLWIFPSRESVPARTGHVHGL